MSSVVRLSERVELEGAGIAEGLVDKNIADRSAAWRATGRPAEELRARAADVRAGYRTGAPLVGAFLGLAVALKLIQALAPRRSKDYEVHRPSCLSCGRCFFYCPQEHARLRDAGIAVLPTDVSRQL
jgi:ferredoxin